MVGMNSTIQQTSISNEQSAPCDECRVLQWLGNPNESVNAYNSERDNGSSAADYIHSNPHVTQQVREQPIVRGNKVTDRERHHEHT